MTINDFNTLKLDLLKNDPYAPGRKVKVNKADEPAMLQVEIIGPEFPTQPETPEAKPQTYNPLQPSAFAYTSETKNKDCIDKEKACAYIRAWSVYPVAKKGKAKAEDWNNLGCAYIWCDTRWAEAIDAFSKAAKKAQDEEKKNCIEENLCNARKAWASLKMTTREYRVSIQDFMEINCILETLPKNALEIDAGTRHLLGLKKL
jgi:hypothetical protein